MAAWWGVGYGVSGSRFGQEMALAWPISLASPRAGRREANRRSLNWRFISINIYNYYFYYHFYYYYYYYYYNFFPLIYNKFPFFYINGQEEEEEEEEESKEKKLPVDIHKFLRENWAGRGGPPPPPHLLLISIRFRFIPQWLSMEKGN